MTPISTNAISIRISLDSSFLGGVGELILIQGASARHGVDATLAKRMTAAKPFQAQPDASSGAVYLNRFTHVFGAGWIEPARGGQQRRDQAFVPGEEQDEDFAHLINRRRTSA